MVGLFRDAFNAERPHMAVLALIPSGDLALVNGDFSFIEGTKFTRQKLAARFQFFKGEWFLDQRQGLPYFRDVFVKNPNLDLIRSLFQKVIVDTPGIASVSNLQLVFDPGARTLAFSFTAKLKNGGAPFVVTPEDRDFLVDISA